MPAQWACPPRSRRPFLPRIPPPSWRLAGAYSRYARTIPGARLFSLHLLAGGTLGFALVQGHALRAPASRAIFYGDWAGMAAPLLLSWFLPALLMLLALLLLPRRFPRAACIFGCVMIVVPLSLVAVRLAIDAPRPVNISTSVREADLALMDDNASKPNVILIVCDTLRSDHLSCYGYERQTSPNIDAFAAESVRYARSYSSASWTLPGHATIFTGLLPHEHGAYSDGFRAAPQGEGSSSVPQTPLAGTQTTLAEKLRELGFRTGAISSNSAWITPLFGVDQGFDFFQSICRTESHAALFPLWCLESADRLLGHNQAFRAICRKPFNTLRREYDRSYLDAAEIFDAAKSWIQGCGQDRFFLFLNLMDAHIPYLPPWPYDRLFDGKIENAPRQKVLRAKYMKPGKHCPEPLLKHLQSQYDGEIASLDEQFGSFLEFLAARGALAGSLLVLTGDHGEFIGEHGLLGHNAGPLRGRRQSPIDRPLSRRKPRRRIR